MYSIALLLLVASVRAVPVQPEEGGLKAVAHSAEEFENEEEVLTEQKDMEMEDEEMKKEGQGLGDIVTGLYDIVAANNQAVAGWVSSSAQNALDFASYTYDTVHNAVGNTVYAIGDLLNGQPRESVDVPKSV